MKISSLIPALNYFRKVQESPESQHDKQQHRQQKDGQKNRQEGLPGEDNPKSEFEVNLESIQSAVESFQSVIDFKKHEIQATLEGDGPGLKVILKDGTGAVIRQFTGEEFLKVREAAHQTTGSSGKILDKKH